MLPPVQVRHHVNYMKSLGVAARKVLAGTSVDESRLADPDYLVDVHDVHQVVTNVIQLSAESGIALKIGTSTRLNDLGIVGYAMASSGTLGQAIGVWLQYGKSPADFPFNLTVLDGLTRGRWGVIAEHNGFSTALYRFYIEKIVTMGKAFGEVLTGEAFEIEEASFTYPAPKHARQYEKAFGCAVSFDAPITRVIVRTPRLDTPVMSTDPEIRELCIRHCSLLARRIARHGPVTARLRSALTASGTIPSLDEAAAIINMSARSMRRHLAAEATTFQQVLDEFRSDLAREYLGAGMMPPKEAAFLLGFTQVDAFRRAFKAWTGQTVGQFQSRQRSLALHASAR